MRQTIWKRLTALALLLALPLSLLPVTALAADALPSASNGVITLTEDVTTTGRALTVESGQDITLNLNGHNISSSYDPYTIEVKTGGKLTIIGAGTITNTSAGSTTVRNYGTLVIGEKGKADSASPTITRVETTNGAGNSAVKNEEDSTLTIYSGTFIGDKRSIQSFGDTTIEGGTFQKTVEAWKYGSDPSSLNVKGGTFEGTVQTRYMENNSSFPKGAEIDITGGTFKGEVKDNCGSAGQYYISISGGTFAVKPDSAYLAEGAAFDGNTVVIPVSGVTLDKEILPTLAVGDTEEVRATVEPANATDRVVTWTSGNTDVVTVNTTGTTGTIKAVGAGQTSITATAGGKTASVSVTVSGLAMEATLPLLVGRSGTLTANQFGDAGELVVTWSTSNSSVAGVKNGKVSAYNPGTATITAKAGSYVATCTVTVTEDVAEAITESMTVGEAFCLYDLLGDLNSMSREKTGSSLDYLTGLTVSTGQGILYYGYSSPDVPGSGVGATQSYYVNPGSTQKGLEDVYFVPASDFGGTAVISYTGYGNGVNFNGTIRIEVENSGDVAYNTAENRLLTLIAEDFATVCRTKTGRSLRYVTFEQPASTKGTLYYNYSSTGQYSQRVSSGTKYYISGSTLLENVSFLPAEGFTGTVTIPYYGTDSADVTYTGRLTITVYALGSGGAADIEYETTPGTVLSFNVSDFTSVCSAQTGGTLYYVYFDLPDASEGTLYYNYTSSTSYGSRVSATERYFRSSSPGIRYIDFVPASGFSGTVTIPYTAYNTGGECYDGNVVIEVDGQDSTLYYSTTKGREVYFDGLDFNEACQAVNGASLNYISFELPSSNRGTLYYNYSSSSRSKVTSGGEYDRSTLSKISFVPKSSYTGTFSIYFSGYDTTGSRFSGTVEITVEDGTAEDTLYYSVLTNGVVQFDASDFNEICYDLTGGSLNYVRFTLPASKYGTLYYNYDEDDKRGTKVSASYSYYRGSASRMLDDVSFVPNSSYTGTVELTYTGYSSSGKSFTGKIEITVYTPTNATIYYTGSALPVQLRAADFRSASANGLPRSLSCIRFTSVPSSAYGKLMVNYTGPGTGTQVTAGTNYYTTAAASSVDDLCFVAKAGYTGTVTLYYTAEDTVGNTISGRVQITIADYYLPNTFNDTANYSWARPSIEFLYDCGVTIGTGNGAYGSAANIRRGDYVLMLVRLFGFGQRTGTNFSDVPSSSYYAQAIMTAKALGIITGDANGRFRPAEAVTRQDVVLILYNAMKAAGWDVASTSTSLLDAYPDGGQVASNARTAMASMIKMGIIHGDGNGRLNPASPITRAEIAVILHRLLTL